MTFNINRGEQWELMIQNKEGKRTFLSSSIPKSQREVPPFKIILSHLKKIRILFRYYFTVFYAYLMLICWSKRNQVILIQLLISLRTLKPLHSFVTITANCWLFHLKNYIKDNVTLTKYQKWLQTNELNVKLMCQYKSYIPTKWRFIKSIQ